ncbi:MAG TPA: hypothetical protein VII94_03210 [Candidatus Saccharimonadales bacterium]
MSKADTLLKRAAVYEKLAIYSDRKAFLQAIAQDSSPIYTLPEQVIEDDRIKDKVPYINPGFQQNLLNENRITPQQSDEAKSRHDLAATGNDIANGEPIDKGQQSALSYVVTMGKVGIPLQHIDGIMGPETRAAINSFKKMIGRPTMSDRAALALAPKYHAQLSQQADSTKQSLMGALKGPSAL